MKPLWILMEREIKTRLAKKGYWVFTIVGLILLVALTFLPSFIHMVSGVTTKNVLINDPQGLVAPTATKVVATSPSSYDFKISVDQTPGVPAMTHDQITTYMKHLHTPVVVVVSGHSTATAAFTLEERGSTDPTTIAQLQAVLRQVVMTSRMSALPANVQTSLNAPVNFSVHQWQSGSKSTAQIIQATILVYFMLIMLFTTIITYGTWVAQGVIEEKTNRIVEMMLVTAKPWQILFGKVLGIGLIGLVQYIIWLGVLAIGLIVRKQLSTLPLGHIPSSTFVLLPVFFVLGYFLYSTLYAIAGSLVNRPEEQQMAMTPVIILVLILFYMSIFGVLPAPGSTFSMVVSFIPILTPMTMFTRAVMTQVPVWQILISIVLTIVLNIVMIRFGARVYHRFALRNSGKSSWKLLWSREGSPVKE